MRVVEAIVLRPVLLIVPPLVQVAAVVVVPADVRDLAPEAVLLVVAAVVPVVAPVLVAEPVPAAVVEAVLPVVAGQVRDSVVHVLRRADKAVLLHVLTLVVVHVIVLVRAAA